MTLLMRDQENIEQGIEQGIKQGIKQGILGSINILRGMGCKEAEIKESIIKTYDLTEDDAEAYLYKA